MGNSVLLLFSHEGCGRGEVLLVAADKNDDNGHHLSPPLPLPPPPPPPPPTPPPPHNLSFLFNASRAMLQDLQELAVHPIQLRAEVDYMLPKLFQKFAGDELRATGKQFPRCGISMTPGIAVQAAFKPAVDP